MPAQPKTTTRPRTKSPAASKKPRKRSGNRKPKSRTTATAQASVPAAGGELRHLPVDEIEPCPFQTRSFPYADDADDPTLQDLARSILATGLLQPIVVRPIGDRRYQLGAGERRLRASKLAGCATILALIRELDDDALAEVAAIENLQRSDLPPLEAAASVALLLRRPGWTAGDVAERIGRSTSYVSRLAKIDDLTPAWRAVVATADHPASRWSVAHLVAVARLAPNVQDEVLASYNPDSWIWSMTAAQLEQQLADRTRRLAQAPWSPADPDLLPEAGACLACPLRSSRHPGLFDEEDDDVDPDARVPPNDRCLDEGCWSRKLHAWLAARHDELLEEHPDLHVVGPWLPADQQPERWLAEFSVTPTKKNEPGAVPCLRIGGRGQLGAFFWATYKPALAPSGPQPVTGADLRRDLERARRHRVLELLTAALDDGPLPAEELLLALLHGLQAHETGYGLGALRGAATLWSSVEDLRTAGDLLPALWSDVVRPRLVERARNLASFAHNAVERCAWDPSTEQPEEILPLLWEELERIARVVGASAEDLRRAVEAELPEPPEWRDIEDDQEATPAAIERRHRLLDA